VVTLGDYVDRGPDSKGVLEALIALQSQCRYVPLLGNHDDMFLQACRGLYPTAFLAMGGKATLESYGIDDMSDFGGVPQAHLGFLERCADYHETDSHIFVHASYLSHVPMGEQPALALRWETLREEVPEPHTSGKAVVAGHTSQRSGKILDLGYLKCIDTGCCYTGGWLTALEVHTGQLWQASRDGKLRSADGHEFSR
jgi:serine/threonine protein phosphatase 1